MKMDI